MEQSKLKKAIIFDCDGTLWEGVIGEDIIKPNWQLRDEIIMLAKRGVIIGICSKNNEADIIPMLQRSLLLWDHYIAVHRINWKDKISNLKEIAQELNIGLDSIVMVDDSDFERAAIALYLPEVMAILPDLLTQTVSEWFNLSGDLSKTQQYKENYARVKFQEQFTNIDAYLTSLEMVLFIRKMMEVDIDRVTELTQKTNQFNLTSKRYSRDQIQELWLKDDIYVLSVKDKFGDSELTGVCIIHCNTIDTFLLSCRILGRNIEYAFIDYIIKDRFEEHCVLIGKYVPSAKNGQVKEFYGNCGFECVDVKDNQVTFVLQFNRYKLIVPNYFTYE